MLSENALLAETFSTHSLPASQQLEAWRNWYGAIFEATSAGSQDEGFAAANSNWMLNGFTFSRVSSPPTCIDRTRYLLRRNPVDHWAFTLSKRTTSDVEVRDSVLQVPPGVPFLLSLGEEMHIGRRQQDERVQLLLARDSFQAIAPLLDATLGMALDASQGRLLADYILLLERNLPKLTPEDGSRLPSAIQAMVGACLAPSVDRLAAAGRQVDLTLMERVRRAVRRNLRSPLLGPDKLCREAATSRSQLYRLLEGEGGVARYIQRRRLSESFAILCDTSNNFSIAVIAETLCFADASNFSRAFRREFGMSPSEVRTASLVGLAPAATSKVPAGSEPHSFADCLRAF
jgi:AraC-like DNA-binding protein